MCNIQRIFSQNLSKHPLTSLLHADTFPISSLFICKETSTIFPPQKDGRNSLSHHLVFTYWRCCSWRHCPGRGNLARHPPFQHLGWEGAAPARGLWSGCSCRTQPAMSGPAALAQQWDECTTPHQNLALVLVLPGCQWGWQAAGSQWQLQERWDLVQQGDKMKIRERGAEVYCLQFISNPTRCQGLPGRFVTATLLFSCHLLLRGNPHGN